MSNEISSFYGLIADFSHRRPPDHDAFKNFYKMQISSHIFSKYFIHWFRCGGTFVQLRRSWANFGLNQQIELWHRVRACEWLFYPIQCHAIHRPTGTAYQFLLRLDDIDGNLRFALCVSHVLHFDILYIHSVLCFIYDVIRTSPRLVSVWFLIKKIL